MTEALSDETVRDLVAHAARRLRELLFADAPPRSDSTAQRARDRVLQQIVARAPIGVVELRCFVMPDNRHRRVLACVSLTDGSEIQEPFDLATPLPAPPDGEDIEVDEAALLQHFLHDTDVHAPASNPADTPLEIVRGVAGDMADDVAAIKDFARGLSLMASANHLPRAETSAIWRVASEIETRIARVESCVRLRARRRSRSYASAAPATIRKTRRPAPQIPARPSNSRKTTKKRKRRRRRGRRRKVTDRRGRRRRSNPKGLPSTKRAGKPRKSGSKIRTTKINM